MMSRGVPERTCLNLRMLSDGGKQDGEEALEFVGTLLM
jgi:hypothetical protein